MADKTINELTAATTMGNDDLLVLQQGGTAKKLSGKQLGDYVYNAAAEKVAEVNQAVDDARESINDIVESVQSMTELGTDTTLTTTGMAADAKAAGDKIKAVETAALADLSQGTASGSVITIDYGADNIPIKKMMVEIEPSQDLHGYDHSWPAGGGTNIFQTTATTKTENGVTWTVNSDGSITVSGTASGYTSLAVGRAIIDGMTGNVTVAYNTTEVTNVSWANVDIRDADDNVLYTITSGGAGVVSYTVDLSNYPTAHSLNVSLKRNNNVATNGKIKLQVVSGSAVLPWSPYENICPITGWTGAKVSRTGKNMANQLAVLASSKASWDSELEAIKFTSLVDRSEANSTICKINKPGQITVSYDIRHDGNDSGDRQIVQIIYTDKTLSHNRSGSSQAGTWRHVTLTSDPNKIVDRVSYGSYYGTAGLPAYLKNIQVEVGTQETAYEPYQGETYDITFPSEAGTVYGGNLEINEDGSGVLTVDSIYLELSGRSGNWLYNARNSANSNVSVTVNYGNIPELSHNVRDVICSHFITLPNIVSSVTSVSHGNAISIRTTHAGFVVSFDYDLFPDVDWNTIENNAARDAVATYATQQYDNGTPIQVVAKIYNPITYALTMPQVKTLFGLNNILADTGDISEFVYRKVPVDSSDIVAKITEIESIISGRETTMTATKNYVSGSFVIVNDILYKLDANVASGETLTPGTNCHMTTVEAEIAERVPNYRSVNGKALSSDVTLTAEDIPYDDSLSEHASGSVGEAVSDLNQQIAELSLQGKVVSILGDSISTYDGWTPVADGHNLTHRNRYVNDTPWYTGTVDDTWWKKLINGLGATLGINDSWAGSKVSNSSSTNTGDVGPDACMAGITRITNLGANGTPDIILFYGGTNDAGTSVTIGTFDSTITYTLDLTTNIWSDFATAYKDAIMRLQHYYPFAKIVVLLPTYTSTYYNTANLDKYNEVIKEVCDYFGVDYFDLRRCGINYANLASTLGDGVHPTVDGFALMENYVRSKLLSIYRDNGVENVVYSVTNTLSVNQNADRYIKGISSGNPYSATITGPIRSLVKVEMGGIDITSAVYNEASGAISIQAVTGDIVISEKTLTQYTNRFSSASSYTNAVNTGGYGWADDSATASIINKPVNLIKIKTSASSGTLEIGVAASVNATTEQITQVQSVSFDSSMISGGYAYVKLPNTITLTGTQLIVLYPENAPDFIWYYRIGGISGTGFYTRVPVVRTSGTAWAPAANALLGFDYFYVS